MGVCRSKPEPTQAEIITRFDRIHAKLQIIREKTHEAKEMVVAGGKELEGISKPHPSLRPVEKDLIAIEYHLDQIIN